MGESKIIRRGGIASGEGDGFSLYRLGEEYTDLTGGWVVGYSESSGSQSKQSDHLLMSSGSNFSRRSYITSNKIDLTNIGFINCAIDVDLDRDAGGGWLYLANNINDDATVAVASYRVTDEIENLSLDVQSITGSYHIGVRVRNSSGSGTRNVRVYRVNLL